MNGRGASCPKATCSMALSSYPSSYFGGKVAAFAETAAVTLGEVAYRDLRECPSHAHRRAFFALLLRGGYEERFRTYGLAYRPFEVAFHAAGTEHRDRIWVPETTVFILELEQAWLDELEDKRQPTPAPELGDRSTMRRMLRLWRMLRSGDAAESVSAESAALELLDGITWAGRIDRRRPRWLDDAIELLRTEYTRPLTMTGVARAVGRHPVYLARAFRKFCGVSVGEYLADVRLRAAFDQLGDPEVPLAMAAIAAGYSDQSRLNKVVKRATGMTPGQWRRFIAYGEPLPSPANRFR
jgi:AraC family transcriptional regulator